jgi:hypothetical protein
MHKLAILATLALLASSARAEPVARHPELEAAIARHFHPGPPVYVDRVEDTETPPQPHPVPRQAVKVQVAAVDERSPSR